MSNIIKVQQSAALTIAEAIFAPGINIRAARNDQQSYADMHKHICKAAWNFLLTCGDDRETAKAISEAFAEDVLSCRDDWKAADVDMFFKTIRQQQGDNRYKIMGNKVTILKLNELASVFDADRAEARAQSYQKDKERIEEVQQEQFDSTDIATAILQRINGKSQKKGKTAAEINEWHRENEAKDQELRDKLNAGIITEEQALQEYNKFLIR